MATCGERACQQAREAERKRRERSGESEPETESNDPARGTPWREGLALTFGPVLAPWGLTYPTVQHMWGAALLSDPDIPNRDEWWALLSADPDNP